MARWHAVCCAQLRECAGVSGSHSIASRCLPAANLRAERGSALHLRNSRHTHTHLVCVCVRACVRACVCASRWADWGLGSGVSPPHRRAPHSQAESAAAASRRCRTPLAAERHDPAEPSNMPTGDTALAGRWRTRRFASLRLPPVARSAPGHNGGQQRNRFGPSLKVAQRRSCRSSYSQIGPFIELVATAIRPRSRSAGVANPKSAQPAVRSACVAQTEDAVRPDRDALASCFSSCSVPPAPKPPAMKVT
jgi:hypothetical protein